MVEFTTVSSRRLPRALWTAVAVACLIGVACGGKIPTTSYYVLAPKPESTTATSQDGPGVVIVPLQASEMLLSDRIVYRESEHKVGFYEYHRWAEDPRTSITDALASHLRRKPSVGQVSIYNGRNRGDYTVRGTIERLEEIDEPAGVKAFVSLRLELISETTRKTVWQSEASADAMLTERTVPNLVANLSSVTETALGELCNRLDAFLRSRAQDESQ